MHNIKRGPSEGTLFHDKGRGNGYVLTYGGKRFYIAGDTEGIPDMRALKDIDVAFVCGMLPHHQGAIDMAMAELQYGDDPWAKQLAQAVIDAQTREIAEMKAWLAKQPK